MKKLNFVVVGLMLVGQMAYAGSSVSDIAGTVQGALIGAAIQNVMEGEKLIPGCPQEPSRCVKAGLAFATATYLADSGDDAGKTKSQVTTGGGGFDGPGYNGENNGGIDKPGSTDGLRNRITAGIKELDRRGYKLDSKTGSLTDPKGKTHSLGALGSGKAMADAGLIGPEDIADMDKTLKDMKDKFKVVSVGVGGGGGGGSVGKSTSYTYDDPYKNLYGNAGGEKPNAPRTSGLTRTLASGESIGSQSDNIFEMIRRRYQQKSEEKIFVGQEPAGQ